MKVKTMVSMLILLVLTMALLPLSSRTSVVKISDDESGDDHPQIAVDCSGNSYVTWYGWDGHDYEIYWVKVDASGTPGTVQMISTHEDNKREHDFSPQIAVDASGNSYVTWVGGWHDTGPWHDIYWVKVDASGTPGTVQMISTHADNEEGDSWFPEIAVDCSGNSYVTWFCNTTLAGRDQIYWVKVDASGVPGIVKKISAHADDMWPQIAVDCSGNSYVTWHGREGNEWIWNIYWVKVDASGTPGTVQMISTHDDNINNSDGFPQIAVDRSGNSYVTWEGYDGIYWVKVDASGTPGTAQKISYADNERHYAYCPQIAVDASGNSYVTWKNMDPDRWEYDIYWVKVDASGTPGTAQKISIFVDTVNNYDSKPQIAVDCSGNSYVTWHGNDGTDNEIYFVGNIVRHPPLLHGVHSSFDVWGDTVDLSIRVANRDLSGKIYNIEIFPACQIPYWDSVEGVEAPEGWSFKKMDNGVRFYTEENPLLTCQLTRFRFRVQGRRISWYIRIHVADSEHEYMGVIVSTRKVIWWLY